jgi:F-type H+-transporting ATPase subunit b
MTRKIKAVAVVIGIFVAVAILILPTYVLAQEGHEGEAESGHGHGFDWGQFLGKSFNSLILFGGLILLLRKPIIKLLAQKSLDIKDDIVQRETELQKSSRQLEELHQRLDKIEAEVAGMKQIAEQSGNEEKKRIEALGAKEAQRILELTDAEINTKVENSIRNLKAKIAELTIEHFKKDIREQLDKNAHDKIIEKNIKSCGEIIERK